MGKTQLEFHSVVSSLIVHFFLKNAISVSTTEIKYNYILFKSVRS